MIGWAVVLICAAYPVVLALDAMHLVAGSHDG